ncbi:hypothetical protein EV715DRAFT_194656 [Schizophyllum commune]
MASQPVPPLLGDGKGTYRILVVGNSGWRLITTLSRKLSTLLGVKHLSMDTLWWKPGWQTSTREEFQDELRKFFRENEEHGWIIDGNFTSQSGGLPRAEATDVIWLDPPLVLYFPRLLIRTVQRLLSLVEPCSEGCDETWSEAFFSKNSILVWCLSQHWILRERETNNLRLTSVDNGTEVTNRKMRRLGGWGGEQEAWLKAVEELVKAT